MVKFCALVIVLALVLGGSANAANWAPQSVAAFGPDFVARNVFFVDSMTGWVVGADQDLDILLEDQRIWKTSDGGTTWTEQAGGGAGLLLGIDFIDANTGFVSGRNGTSKETKWTTDGGATWHSVNQPGANFMHDIDSPDGTNAWSVGDYEKARYSADGGQTWSDQALNGFTGAQLSSVEMLSSTNGFISTGDGQIFKTTDGLSWSSVFSGPSTFDGLKFVSANVGFASRYDSVFMRTGDGGLNWTELSLPFSGARIPNNGMYFVSETEGWALVLSGATPAIYHTTDAGSSWELQYQFENDVFVGALNFSDPATGWAVGENSLPPSLMSAFGPALFAEATSPSFLLQFDPNAPGIELDNPLPEPAGLALVAIGLLFLRKKHHAPPGA